ncbi:putative glycolipid-binding domain-containing protein [Pararhizobium sp. BT-229]|uniref:putative glycolipid-binding domain-containing protein n=1 Tax=Pararhizobium sp. BT-229 TaxID=2986923 RepID=UPI0021F6EC9D|nr:putative glycolipid-binding domain-containing protein [Pararhizobium sp. BT-229]MCV9966416.1 putative glycolipid-binding domain-containing protein [Pararhizobium sp. BT-229]
MELNRSIRWRGMEIDTVEHCEVIAMEAGRRIRGVIVAPAYGLHYSIELNEALVVRSAVIERTDGRTLALLADGSGNWTDERANPRPELAGCIDIDLWPTPLTNSLPVWRSHWVEGEPRHFTMAWIDGDEMTVRREDQFYTKLDSRHFRFQNTDGFEQVLELDDDGLVVDYPTLFKRL